MSMSARSIALQGFGFGARHVALQGFVPMAAFSVGGRRVRLPRAMVDAQRLGAIEEDDAMLLLASAVISSGALL